MLEIHLQESEVFNQNTSEFVKIKPITVKLEHSLISIAKWESIWEVPYLPTKGVNEGISGREQQLSYIKCMIIGKVPDYVPRILMQEHSDVIYKYIDKPHSATTIHHRGPRGRSRQVITSEVVYYWMTKYRVPIEFERWHFNRLIKFLEVCAIKETPPKQNKVSRREAINEIYKLNAERRAALEG